MITLDEYMAEHGADEEYKDYGTPFVGELRIIDGEECEFTEEGVWVA
jgi:hypothetical protein